MAPILDQLILIPLVFWGTVVWGRGKTSGRVVGGRRSIVWGCHFPISFPLDRQIFPGSLPRYRKNSNLPRRIPVGGRWTTDRLISQYRAEFVGPRPRSLYTIRSYVVQKTRRSTNSPLAGEQGGRGGRRSKCKTYSLGAGYILYGTRQSNQRRNKRVKRSRPPLDCFYVSLVF